LSWRKAKKARITHCAMTEEAVVEPPNAASADGYYSGLMDSPEGKP